VDAAVRILDGALGSVSPPATLSEKGREIA